MVPLRWNSQDTPGPRPAVATPADFAPKTISTPAAAKPPQKPKDPKSIWDEDEAPAVEDTIDPADPRKRPQCVTCCVYFSPGRGVRVCVSVSRFLLSQCSSAFLRFRYEIRYMQDVRTEDMYMGAPSQSLCALFRR